jgi:competence protein ComEC
LDDGATDGERLSMKWPLLKPLLFYVTGVLLGHMVQVQPYLLLAASFIFLAVALSCTWLWRTSKPEAEDKDRVDYFKAWAFRLLLCLILLVGWTNCSLQTAVLSPHDLRRIIGAEPKLATVRGTIIETPSLRVYELGETPSWRTLARIEVSAVHLDKQDWQPAAGRIAVATSGTLTNLFGGQVVEIFGVLAFPKRPIAEGTFDYSTFLAEQQVYYHLQAESDQDWTIIQSPKLAPLADRFRTWARYVLARGLPAEDESLRLEWALTLGWKTALDEQSSEPFIRAATYHIFAVDGLRMAIVFGILFGLLRALNVPRAICGIALLPLIWFYVALTGWPASAIRATVMLSIIIAGWALKRPSNLINSLLAAAIIILVWDPQQLFQAGFQLSFVVVLSMILMLPTLIATVHGWLAPDPLLPKALQRRWPGFIKAPAAFCGDLCFTSFAAWVGSIPLVAYYFNIVTPVSTPANVFAVPLCALVLVSNLASLLLVSWLPGVAELFNHAGWFLMECIRVTSLWFANWPTAWFYVPAPSLFTTTLYYALLFAVISGWLLKPAFRPAKLAATGLVLAVWCGTWLPELFTTRLTVLPANGGVVIYSDAAGRQNDLLIDTGNTNAVQFVAKPALRAQGVNSVRNLALSHGDLKHVGGARILSDTFPAHRIWQSPVRFRSTAYRRLIKGFEEAGGSVEKVARAEKIACWEVLHPERQDRFSRADDGTLVLRGNIAGTRILLLGDLGGAGQEALRERTTDLRAEILITGLPTVGEPVSDDLLKAIQPRLIVVADSEFPASERATPTVRERLTNCGARVISTRDAGATTIEFRRGHFRIRTISGARFEG